MITPKMFATIKNKDYTVTPFYASSPMGWELVSSSVGISITSPTELEGAVTITRAKNYSESTQINIETGVNEYVLYSSIKHLFYRDTLFFNGSSLATASLSGLPNDSYVVSIGQYFYGEEIKPGSFQLAIDSITDIVEDDSYGNLFVSSSGTGYFVGNIFYDKGIAVISHNTASAVGYVGQYGLKIVNGSEIYVDYNSNVKITRHEVNVKIEAPDFNHSLFNPSIKGVYVATGSFTSSLAALTASLEQKNIPTTGSNRYALTNLMAGQIIKPYVTSIGLYNDRYELLAVAKLSTPIQRTFDMEQIFIVRFDT